MVGLTGTGVVGVAGRGSLSSEEGRLFKIMAVGFGRNPSGGTCTGGIPFRRGAPGTTKLLSTWEVVVNFL